MDLKIAGGSTQLDTLSGAQAGPRTQVCPPAHAWPPFVRALCGRDEGFIVAVLLLVCLMCDTHDAALGCGGYSQSLGTGQPVNAAEIGFPSRTSITGRPTFVWNSVVGGIPML